MFQPSQPLFLKHLILPIQTANKHMKKMKIQHRLLLEKCKSRLQWDIPHTSQNGHQQKKSTNSKCWRGCGEKGMVLHCRWECKLMQPLWETVWKFLKNLGIKPPYDPAIPLLGIYPEETKTEKKATCYPSVPHSTIYNSWNMEET